MAVGRRRCVIIAYLGCCDWEEGIIEEDGIGEIGNRPWSRE